MIENVWEQDAFSVMELSNSLNELPSFPGRAGKLGVFVTQGVKTTSVVLENRAGIIGLVPDTPRGAGATINPTVKRVGRAYKLTHLPQNDSVLADDVQGIRAFGSDTELEQLSTVVNDRLAAMKINIDATREHLRVGALQGTIMDADGVTVLADLFSDFGITRTTVAFDLANNTDVRTTCIGAKRVVEAALGSIPIDHVHAFCTNTFFDAFISNADVKAQYLNWASNEMNRSDNRAGFEYGGIIWENYDPQVGTYKFILDGDAAIFPVTRANVFKEFVGPADYMETANTIGKEYYAKQQPKDFGKGIDLEAQSNPLPLCAVPACLVQGITTTAAVVKQDILQQGEFYSDGTPIPPQ